MSDSEREAMERALGNAQAGGWTADATSFRRGFTAGVAYARQRPISDEEVERAAEAVEPFVTDGWRRCKEIARAALTAAKEAGG